MEVFVIYYQEWEHIEIIGVCSSANKAWDKVEEDIRKTKASQPKLNVEQARYNYEVVKTLLDA